MDCSGAIEKNREALKRIVAMLVAMAGLDASALTSRLWGGRREASGGGCNAEDTPTRRSDDRRPPHKGEVEPAFTLPRHLHRAILRLLRPAESAARRLIIAAACRLFVLPSRRREPGSRPATAEPLLRRFGIAVVMSPADLARSAAAAGRDAAAAHPRSFSLPLFDPLPRFRVYHRYVPAHAAPRIMFPGVTEPFSLPPPPSLDDPIDAAPLGLRLAALAAALDDLPGQARRFARWKASRDAARALKRPAGRIRRISPLRPGRPPGGRLSRYDPTVTHPRKIREVDEILAHAHALACYAVEAADTS